MKRFTYAALATAAILAASAAHANQTRDTSWKATPANNGQKMCPRVYADHENIAALGGSKATRILTLRASWYGDQFHGRAMADGDVFHECDATVVAFNSLPLGTVLRVTNLNLVANETYHRVWYLVVQDRGGEEVNRRLDLSRGAAQMLDPNYMEDGVLNLKVEVLGIPSS